ncbi:MAG: TonB-dependent receptor domain-containing protein [Gemmatimonadaceae bacterium]
MHYTRAARRIPNPHPDEQMNDRFGPRSPCRELLSGALLAFLSAGAGAQSVAPAPSPRGVISGEVVDAEMLRPLSGATVVLVPAGPAVLPPAVETGSSFLSLARSVVTGELGAYRFTDLPFGNYRLRVQRVGYRPVTIDVQLRASDDARVSVGLTVAPIRLHALTVRAEPRPPYGRMETATAEQDSTRVAAARLRQRLFLGTDVREVTHPDVVESVTLGATDLFRAFHRLPGVTTRDDEAAELWTRGSRPDLTRVYFDGQPVFSTLHSFGLLSGIGTNAVGAAFLHPGVRPASIGEGAAAVVDVRSRPGGGSGGIRGITEITSGLGYILNTSTRAALDQRVLGGRAAWMLAGGRSMSDLVFRDMSSTNEIVRPAYFADLTGRVDYDLGSGRRLEVSGLWLRDVRRDNPDANPFGKRFAWGTDVGRATLAWPFARLRSRHTIGASRYRAAVDTLVSSRFDESASLEGWYQYLRQLREVPLRSSVLHASLSGEFEPSTAGVNPPPWTLGYELTARRVEFAGDVRYVLLRIESERSSRVQSSPTASLWGTWRWPPAGRLRIEPGLRVDVGPAPANGGVVRAMPRVQARFSLDSQTALSAGVGRSIQYTQTVGRLERAFEAITFPTALWLAADDSTPALYADVATIGVERWLGASWLAAANAYHRRSTGYLVRDPAPGRVADRGLVVDGEERASGVELSARKLAGRLTGSAAYTYGVARTTAAGLTFPSSQDRRHSFDMTLLARLKPSVQLSAAYTYATGAPYTRLRSMRAAQPPEAGGSWREMPDSLLAEEPNALRMPPYSSLDLAIEWTFGIGGAKAATYFQMQNVLRHENFGPYSGERWCTSCRDAFYQNQIMRPAIGIRARF